MEFMCILSAKTWMTTLKYWSIYFTWFKLNYSLSEKSSLDFGMGFYLDRFFIEEKIGLATNKGNRSISQIQKPINFNLHFNQDNSYQLGIGIIL